MAGIKPEVVGWANKTKHASSQKGMAGSKKICHRLIDTLSATFMKERLDDLD